VLLLFCCQQRTPHTQYVMMAEVVQLSSEHLMTLRVLIDGDVN